MSEISVKALAYLGDCVIELCVRRFLVSCGISHSAELNTAALNFVRAGAQAEAVKKLLPMLTEAEAAAFRRGRNIGHTSTPKSASVGQYRSATGMEVLFGWLDTRGESDRVNELFLAAYPELIDEYKRKAGII